MNIKTLMLKNLIRRPLRTGVLVLTAAVMTAAMFGGQAAAKSMRNGLDSLEQRLGADIIVLPEDAQAKTDLENILLQGTPGYFYMDKAVVSKIAETAGIDKLSAQYFLVSANAECCTTKVQIIGFDEESDFTVKPWLKNAYSGSLKKNEIIIGSALSTKAGSTLTLYGVECKAAGKLEETGTGLDTAVYATNETVQGLIEASQQKGISVLTKHSPDEVISSVYIKVKDGSSIDDVVYSINQNIDGVQAVRTKSMITGTADKLDVFSKGISIVTVAAWLLSAVIMTAVFSALAGGRRREFAVLRTVGFSRKRLGALVLSESLIVSAAGAAAGIALTAFTVLHFGRVIEQGTGLPYLSPNASSAAGYAALAAAAVMLTGALSSAWAAYRLSHADTGTILREGD
ncbi:MAG: ABC transporter permease [Ruminococcus sp.]|nr:ABC transporter permease [Ruminococcus sp.]